MCVCEYIQWKMYNIYCLYVIFIKQYAENINGVLSSWSRFHSKTLTYESDHILHVVWSFNDEIDILSVSTIAISRSSNHWWDHDLPFCSSGFWFSWVYVPELVSWKISYSWNPLQKLREVETFTWDHRNTIFSNNNLQILFRNPSW